MDGLLLQRDQPEHKQSEPPLLAISETAQPTRSESTVEPLDASALLTEDSVLSALSSVPPRETVVATLRLLSTRFDVRTPSPKGSLIVKCLLDKTFPDYWDTFSNKDRVLLTKVLVSPTGLNGITTRLKFLIRLVRKDDAGSRKNLEQTLELLYTVIQRHDIGRDVLDLARKLPAAKRQLIWMEYCSLIAGGRLLSTVAEAGQCLGKLYSDSRSHWAGNGQMYTTWLGKEMARLTLEAYGSEDDRRDAAIFLSTGFRLGYTNVLVEKFTLDIIKENKGPERLLAVLEMLRAHDKRSYLLSLLKVLSSRSLPPTSAIADESWWKADADFVACAAALLSLLTLDNEFRDSLMEWLTTSASGFTRPTAIIRAAVHVLSQHHSMSEQLFLKSLQQFADPMWIKHAPIVRQEENVQTLLLCAGVSHRTNNSLLVRLTRSSDFLNGVSERLGSSSNRVRFLGMIVAESFSALVDTENLRMSFQIEETLSDDARWWKAFTTVQDTVGSVTDLLTHRKAVTQKPMEKSKTPDVSPSGSKTAPPGGADWGIDEEDGEFAPYSKPDSDLEDPPDEDASTLDRNKPTAPVYVRDLISHLKATNSYEKQQLALAHATALIRRKTSMRGAELSPHLETLLSLFVGLQDRFELPEFSTLVTNALTSLIISSPVRSGRYLAQQFFWTDYSLHQRAVLLTSIGLAARELAGFATPPALPPSRALPPAYSQIESITSTLQKAYLAPLAAQTTGPTASVLKISSSRKFSSRRTTETTGKTTHRSITIEIADAFLYPLTGGWWVAARDGSAILSQPHTVSLLVKTLTVTIHAAGPAAPALRDMTREFLTMLLAMRRVAEDDVLIMEAVLGALVVIVEIGGEGLGKKALAEEFGEEMMASMGWAEGIFERVEDGYLRGLAAGAVAVLAEVMDEYRRVIMGNWVED